MKRLTSFVPDVIKQPKTLAEVDGGVHVVLAEAIQDYRTSQHGIEADELERRIEAGKAVVTALLAKCESPIERLIVPALVFQPYGSNGPWEPAQIHGTGVKGAADVVIDGQVTTGDSRFDFLVGVHLPGELMLIAIECDGKEFHDNVKDYFRDRNWLLSGITTVRLTGSDIHKAPRMAASRVAEAVLRRMVNRGIA